MRACCGFVVVLGLVMSGCGGDGVRPAPERRTFRGDARAFVAAGDRLFAELAEISRAGERRFQTQFRSARCERVIPTRSPAYRKGFKQAHFAFVDAIELQQARRPFAHLAAYLRLVHTPYPELRTIESSTRTIAEELTRVPRVKLDFCRLLFAWRRESWRAGYPETYFDAVARRGGYRRSVIIAAIERTGSIIRSLERRGLTSAERADLLTFLVFGWRP